MVDSLVPRDPNFTSPPATLRAEAQGAGRAAEGAGGGPPSKAVPARPKGAAAAEAAAGSAPAERTEAKNADDRPRRPVEEIEREVESLNQLLMQNIHLQFRVNKESGETIIEIRDKQTNEILKTIPPSALGDLRNRITSGGGVLVDGRT